MRRAGRHFLQIPGPSHVPDRILRAMDQPVIDHRGPAFADLGKRVLHGMQTIFNTAGPRWSITGLSIARRMRSGT